MREHSMKSASLEDRDEAVHHLIVSTKLLRLEQKVAEMLEIIETLLYRVERLLDRAVELRSSVANHAKERSNQYLLPSALLRAAKDVFRFVYTACYTVRYVQTVSEEPSVDIKLHRAKSQDNAAVAEHYGFAAENAFVQASEALLLMAHTGTTEGASVVSYETIEQDDALVLCLGRMASPNVIRLYQEYLSSLVSDRIRRYHLVCLTLGRDTKQVTSQPEEV